MSSETLQAELTKILKDYGSSCSIDDYMSREGVEARHKTQTAINQAFRAYVVAVKPEATTRKLDPSDEDYDHGATSITTLSTVDEYQTALLSGLEKLE